MEVLDQVDVQNQKSKVNKVGRVTAYISGSIGLLILLLYIFTRNEEFQFAGFFYLLIAGFVNVVMLLIVIINMISNKNFVREGGYTILIMLANIPLAFLCAYLGLEVFNFNETFESLKGLF